jgi:flagellin
MPDVTLTAAMRSNLLSLQQTADLMGSTQGRLASGKKVNSALDGPINFFAAQSLSNRANDISALLDGMGQAIQAIKAATEGIESAKKVVEQMKSVATQAAQSASDSGSGSTTAVETKGLVDTTKQFTTAASSGATAADDVTLLTNINNKSTSAKLDIRVGDTFVITHDTNNILTFTVSETSTMQDLQQAIEEFDPQNGADAAQIDIVAAITTEGKLSVAVAAGNAASTGANDDMVISGDVATALGINGTLDLSASLTNTGSVQVGKGPAYLEDNDSAHRLAALTDSAGALIGIEYGDTLSIQYGDNGEVLTFTVGFDDTQDDTAVTKLDKAGYGHTLEDLDAWLDAQTSITSSVTSTGQFKLSSAATTDQVFNVTGSLVSKLGLSSSVAQGAGTAGDNTGTVELYVADQSSVPVATGSTMIRDISRSNGEVIRALALTTQHDAGGDAADVAAGETITIETTTGTNTVRISNNATIDSLLAELTAVDSGLTISINATGNLVVDNQTAGTITIGGTVGSALFNNSAPQTDIAFASNTSGNAQTAAVTIYAAFGTAGGATSAGVPSASFISQYDTLHTQLDTLVADASYQGANLISGTSNSPLKVVFNEAATNANKLEISAVDMTTTGLSIAKATDIWTTSAVVETAIEGLTAALTSLREQASSFGQNLTLVQTRQDFANNIIATLREGSDMLTLADMNEEGANMLALQTRSQLGTQSLALASQANASVLRLFG